MKKFLKVICIVAVIVIVIVLGINFLVVGLGGRDLITEKEAVSLLADKTSGGSSDSEATGSEASKTKTEKPDCIMVLGAQVKPDGTPSTMLADRLDTAIQLYKYGVAPKLLLSGDDGQIEYNEVTAMLEYAKVQGVPAKDIFLDHAGFSTYESVYRAQYIFGVKNMVIVTQRYHEYRALYIAQRFGIEVKGVSAVDKRYINQGFRDIREIMARDKDFFKCIVKPEPTYLGDKIDISGDGRVTQ
jgi:vancomycin permeability regulator SanA